jgi:hypothetical protein
VREVLGDASATWFVMTYLGWNDGLGRQLTGTPPAKVAMVDPVHDSSAGPQSLMKDIGGSS